MQYSTVDVTKNTPRDTTVKLDFGLNPGHITFQARFSRSYLVCGYTSAHDKVTRDGTDSEGDP